MDFTPANDVPKCAYKQLGYYWKDLKPDLEGLSNIHAVPSVQSIAGSKYYVDSLPLSEDLTVPDDLAESLDGFFALSVD